MSLPDGYTTTTAAGVLVLWRVAPDGGHYCVTVLADSVMPETVAAIANRDAAFGRPKSYRGFVRQRAQKQRQTDRKTLASSTRTVAEIGQQSNISKAAVRRDARRAGIKIKSRNTKNVLRRPHSTQARLTPSADAGPSYAQFSKTRRLSHDHVHVILSSRSLY